MILDPKIRLGEVLVDWQCESTLIDFIAKLDRFCLDHPKMEMWIWAHSWSSLSDRSFLDRVLIRRADVDLIFCSMFQWLNMADHKLVMISLCLGSRPQLAGYWKFNAFLLERWDFQDQLENLIQKALIGVVVKNQCWILLKYRIWYITVKYCQQFMLDMAMMIRALDERLNQMVNGEGYSRSRAS